MLQEARRRVLGEGFFGWDLNSRWYHLGTEHCYAKLTKKQTGYIELHNSIWIPEARHCCLLRLRRLNSNLFAVRHIDLCLALAEDVVAAWDVGLNGLLVELLILADRRGEGGGLEEGEGRLEED